MHFSVLINRVTWICNSVDMQKIPTNILISRSYLLLQLYQHFSTFANTRHKDTRMMAKTTWPIYKRVIATARWRSGVLRHLI